MAKNDEKDQSMSTSEAGKLGGEKVRDERGPEFYSEIGKQQGKENNPGNFANRPKEDVQEAGREGGKNSHRGDSDDAS
jgi:general stress protein YciG